MNVGQILETHLGWAAAAWAKGSTHHREKIQPRGNPAELKSIYTSQEFNKYVDGATERRSAGSSDG